MKILGKIKLIKATIEQSNKTREQAVDSKKDPFILKEFEADENSQLPTERIYFSMSQL